MLRFRALPRDSGLYSEGRVTGLMGVVLMRLLVVPLLGGVAAFGGTFALIHAQTGAPSTNPADQSALVYGQ